MTVLYHHRTQAEDAQGVHIYEMVKAFEDLGHDVAMVALAEVDTERGDKTRGKGWGVVAKWAPDWLYELMGLAYNVYGYARLRRVIRQRSPDFIYERYGLNTFCGVWASRRFGIPIIVEVNAPLSIEQQDLGRLTFRSFARFSERWICSHSTRTVVVTQVMKDLLAGVGVPPDQMVVMPNGVDPEKFNPEVSGQAVRSEYGVQDEVVLGFVGWFRKWHGLEMFLEAVAEAGLAKGDVKVMLVGDGPAGPDLKRSVRSLGLEDTVVFTGPVSRERVRDFVAAMDVTVQPSATTYACPMKIIEYMAMGKCIVAPDQPNIRELLVHGESGVLFAPNDKESLRNALTEVLGDERLRRSAGRTAYQASVRRGLTWQANARRAMALARGKDASPAEIEALSELSSRQRRQGQR